MRRSLRAAAIVALFAASPIVAAHEPRDAALATYEFRMSRHAVFTATPEEAVAGAQVLCDHVSGRAAPGEPRFRIRPAFAQSFVELADELQRGTTQGAYVTALEYLQLRDRMDVRIVGLTLAEDGRSRTRAALVVRADDKAAGLADLRGRRYARAGRTSTAGRLFPEATLLAAGLPDLHAFFGRVVEAKSPKSAFYAVALGEADVAGVPEEMLATLAERQPAIAQRCRVLAMSEPLPTCAIVLSPTVPAHVAAAMRATFDEETASTPRLREAAALMGIGGIAAAADSDFDGVRALWRILQSRDLALLDPVCGSGTDPEAAPREILRGATFRFCSETCRVRFREIRAAAVPGAPNRLAVIGIGSIEAYDRDRLDARGVMASLRSFAAELERGFPGTIEMIFVPTREQERALIDERVLSFLRVSGPEFVGLTRDGAGVTPFARHVTSASDSIRSLLLSRTAVTGVADLRGKSIAVIADSGSLTSLQLRGLQPELTDAEFEAFFRTILRCPTEGSVLRALSSGQCDAALVTSEALRVYEELEPSRARALVTVRASEEMVNGPMCSVDGADAAHVAAMRDVVLRMHESPSGAQVLELFKILRMVPAVDSDYESTRRLVDALGIRR